MIMEPEATASAARPQVRLRPTGRVRIAFPPIEGTRWLTDTKRFRVTGW
jgi:hypothetical protein